MKNLQRPTNIVETLLTEIVKVAVREVLAEERAQAPTRVYTSSPKGPNPPGKSARWAREHLRHVPGARKIGSSWIVSAEDFDRWAEAQTPTRRAKVVPIRNADTWSPVAALEAAQHRGSR